ncbi:hypothetical protein DXG01_016272 [Tephrocybe rancida]|nr:hypothetical protein DXG01_016272 [Tephrocybe rancida]
MGSYSNSPFSSLNHSTHTWKLKGRSLGRPTYLDFREPPVRQQPPDKVLFPTSKRALHRPSTSPAKDTGYEKALKKMSLKHRAFFAMSQPHVPAGHVHVRLFTNLDLVYRRFWSPSLETVLPLEPDGGFDLQLIKKLWKLDTCIPISPIHWKAVEPSTEDSLSPFAVVSLTELYNCITFIGE